MKKKNKNKCWHRIGLQYASTPSLFHWIIVSPYLMAQMVKNLPAMFPWVGNIPWRREWQPTPAFLPGEFHGQRSPGLQSMGSQGVRHDFYHTEDLTWCHTLYQCYPHPRYSIKHFIQKKKQRLRELKSLCPLPEHISTVSVWLQGPCS